MRTTALFLTLLLSTACVERRLWVRTRPEGARVSVNGAEVGRSPVHWRFFHYGTVLVEAELEGYEPIQKVVKLRSPWYQKPVVDFFADVVVPVRIHDDHHVQLELVRQGRMSPAEVEKAVREVTKSAAELRREAGTP